MKRLRIAKTVGLVGLVGLLNSSDVQSEEKFSISGSLGGYSPFGDIIALNGIPYGFEVEGDYGNRRTGFKAGGAWFTKTGDKRGEFSLLNRNVVEGKNIFETADRKFLRQELRQFVESRSLHGAYGEFSVGGPIKKSKKAGIFLKGTYDHFFDKYKSSGIKFSAGITFLP